MKRVVNLRGELGNQMFQVATGIALSTYHQSEVQFRTISGTVSRLAEFNCSKNYRIYIDSSLKSAFINFLELKSKRVKLRSEYREVGVNFNDLSQTKAKLFTGFFHSWRYFDHLKNKIKDEFELINPSQQFLLLSKQVGSDFTALHIRRGGGGAAILNSNFHGLVDEDYYNRAIRLNESLGGSRDYVIFTDNIYEASKVVQSLEVKPRMIISPKQIDSQVENLHLMAQCSGFIGANSSYSWWAAYLAKNLKINPIFPRQWYMDPELSNSDMLLPDWISVGFKKFANENTSRNFNAKLV